MISHRDDDGEGGAADKLAFLLDASDARDVVVVVTRWFGGILLGADRFKHISNVAKELLQQEGYIKKKVDEVCVVWLYPPDLVCMLVPFRFFCCRREKEKKERSKCVTLQSLDALQQLAPLSTP